MYKTLQLKLQILFHKNQYKKNKSFYHKQQIDTLRYKLDRIQRGKDDETR